MLYKISTSLTGNKHFRNQNRFAYVPNFDRYTLKKTKEDGRKRTDLQRGKVIMYKAILFYNVKRKLSTYYFIFRS